MPGPNKSADGPSAAAATKSKQPLSVTHPELAVQWHPTKNGDARPEHVTAGSSKKVWWKCPKEDDHEWEATICSRVQGAGCPCCSGRKATKLTCLFATRPDLAKEWHPKRNGELTPADVSASCGQKVWWLCSVGHEWEAKIANRNHGRGCPYCSNKKAGPSNCLVATHPALVAEWHPTRNTLTPYEVVGGSSKKVWWKCKNGHEWQATIDSRVGRGSGCPFCINQKTSRAASLATTHPELAAQWHPSRNHGLTPWDVVAGSNKKVWWKCAKGDDHEWPAIIANRAVKGMGCPCCARKRVSQSNCLATVRPDVAAEWHQVKNEPRTPSNVVAGSHLKVWWRCANGHEWQATILSRTYGDSGCPYCCNRLASLETSLATTNPEIAKEWHPTKNDGLTPRHVTAGSSKKVWWKCPNAKDHEWRALVAERTSGNGCPYCSHRRVVPSNSLAVVCPEIAKEWHPELNGTLTPVDVVAGGKRKVWWKCSAGHAFQATIENRINGRACPACSAGWNVNALRGFVASLSDHLHTFTPAELYLIFQHNRLFQTAGKGKSFVRALATGRFPHAELEKFVNAEPSLVDQFVQDPSQTLEQLETAAAKAADDALDAADGLIDAPAAADEAQLPTVETKNVLEALGHHVVVSADEEAVEFLIASAIAKIWKHAYQDEAAAVAQAEAFSGEGYAEQVRSRFLHEYRQAQELPLPGGYAFRVNGQLTPPNLMQRHFAIRVRERKRVGNWSGTGAGKTLAAILATRVVGSRLTVVCCPNSVVDGWRDAIMGVFPDSVVRVKTFAVDEAARFVRRRNKADEASRFVYVVLNYEAFQQPDSAERVREFVEREQIDFLIVDEIHYAKQRAVEDVSQRRRLVEALSSRAAERNPDLHVLGMSATPVINNLQEGKSMVELVSGVAHDELDTRPTVANCMSLHQRLVTLGIRWMPDYKRLLGYECSEERIEVDCGDFLGELRALGGKGSPLALEQILTRARLPVIRQNVRKKTLIYTYYIDGIDRLLRDALVEDGWRVGFYTGDDKSGKDAFIAGDLDVLIATAAIGTGVDGLQHVCNRLIINVLPWTRAEYDQLLGRIYRQGQRDKKEVRVVIPLTYATVNGERWSWCESKMQRLAFKKSIADAAVDGVVPEGHLRTAAQAYQDVMAWLQRLQTGQVEVISRPRIVVPLPANDPGDVNRRQRRYGDFSALNRAWNHGRSESTHERLQANPEEWQQYHTLYQEARKEWTVVPYEEMIRWCQKRSGLAIGDFGCGEAKLAEALKDRHTVHSFDHVAINDSVIACDMAHVPLDNETLDVAIFSLALMGANFTDYLREAHRTLKLDGQLHILEATSRFSDRERFAADLKKLGFGMVSVEDKWKFTHIRALKTEARPHGDVVLTFAHPRSSGRSPSAIGMG